MRLCAVLPATDRALVEDMVGRSVAALLMERRALPGRTAQPADPSECVVVVMSRAEFEAMGALATARVRGAPATSARVP